MDQTKQQKIVLANGCFWCTEAVFKRLRGVDSAVSGYANSNVEKPSYEQVSSGQTGAAEAVEVGFDPRTINLATILEVFFATHDPTTLNRQGNDSGTQYRSAIFFTDDDQKHVAEQVIANLDAQGKFDAPIVTVVEPLKNFTVAEDYHLDFYDQNRGYAYCQLIIDPKITKLYKNFSGQLKEPIE